MLKNLYKLKNIKSLLLLLLPFLMQGQDIQDTVNIEGVYYCSRDLYSIIKKKKKVMYVTLPEQFVSDTIVWNIDSSYVFIKEKKYLQKIYSSKKIKFKTLESLNNSEKKIYIENLINKRKGEIEFTEFCNIISTGARLLDNRYLYFYFKAKFDGHEQNFSVRFSQDLMVLNFGFPSYIKCK